MELYDLVTDPAEQRNIHAERPTVAASMLQRLRALDTTKLPLTMPGADGGLAERLASLGYVSRSLRPAHPSGAGSADPKDRIDIYNKLTSGRLP